MTVCILECCELEVLLHEFICSHFIHSIILFIYRSLHTILWSTGIPLSAPLVVCGINLPRKSNCLELRHPVTCFEVFWILLLIHLAFICKEFTCSHAFVLIVLRHVGMLFDRFESFADLQMLGFWNDLSPAPRILLIALGWSLLAIWWRHSKCRWFVCQVLLLTELQFFVLAFISSRHNDSIPRLLHLKSILQRIFMQSFIL